MERSVTPAVFFLGLGMVTLWLSARLSDHAAADALGGSFLPRVLALSLILLSVLLVVGESVGVRSGKHRRIGDLASADQPEAPLPTGGRRRVLQFGASLLAYSALLPVIGYLAASFLAFGAMIFIAGERRLARVAVAAATTTAALYLLFGVGFNIEVPSGWIFR